MQLARGTPGGSGTLCNLQGGPLVVRGPYATCKGDPWWFRYPMQLARGTPGGSGTLCNLQGGPLVVQGSYATYKGDPWWLF